MGSWRTVDVAKGPLRVALVRNPPKIDADFGFEIDDLAVSAEYNQEKDQRLDRLVDGVHHIRHLHARYADDVRIHACIFATVHGFSKRLELNKVDEHACDHVLMHDEQKS